MWAASFVQVITMHELAASNDSADDWRALRSRFRQNGADARAASRSAPATGAVGALTMPY
jgi:hypothetical protein